MLLQHRFATSYAIFIALLCLFLAGCDNDNSNLLSQSGLVYCSDGAPDNFNPQTGTSYTNFDASARVIFNRLVSTNNSTGIIEPALASHWEMSSDGRSYLFHLRKDVNFQNTQWFQPKRLFNAEDVVFSFNRQKDEQNNFHKQASGEFNYYQNMGLEKNLRAILARTAHQVEFQLVEPDSSFLHTLSMDFASILSAEYAAKIEAQQQPLKNLDKFPVGTGPYKLKKYQQNAVIRYQAHENYYASRVHLKNLVYAITPAPSLRYARLITGECDVLTNPPKSQYELLSKNPDVNIYQKPGLNIGYMAFNTDKKPFDDANVRKALSMAINKARIIDTVYGKLGTNTDTPVPPSMTPFHNPNIKLPKYNPEQSKLLLSEAGHNQLSLELWVLPVQRSYNPNGMLMAELIQEDLRKVGVTTTIVSYEWNTYLDKVRAGEHEMALLGWVADTYDAGDFLRSLLGCTAIKAKTNRSHWCNLEFDALLNQASLADNIEEKIALYHKAQELAVLHLPILPIATGQSVMVANKQVQNLELQTLGGVSFTDVSKVAKDD